MGVTPWVRHTPQRAMNAKLRRAGFAARGLDDAAIEQVAFDDSDGFISENSVEVLAVAYQEKRWRQLVAILVREDRWEPTVRDGMAGWLIHDYEEFNFTKAYWLSQQSKKQEAGRKGGKARGQASVQARASTSALPDAVADVQALPQAASLRFVTTPTSSSSDAAQTSREFWMDDDDQRSLIEEAIDVLARRDLAAVEMDKGPRHDPELWLVAARQKRLARHRDQLAQIVYPIPSLECLVTVLDPPKVKPLDPVESSQRAQRLLMERNEQRRRETVQ